MNVLQACLMLSLENDYPPTYQLALDMLKVLLFLNTAAFPILILSKIHTCSILKNPINRIYVVFQFTPMRWSFLYRKHQPNVLLNDKRYYYSHNYNKILKSDWLSTVLISAPIRQCNRTTRHALDSMYYCTCALK